MTNRSRGRVGGSRELKKKMERNEINLGKLSGIASILVVALILGPDLFLGPFFLLSQAKARGIDIYDWKLEWGAWVVSIFFSIVATGLTFALWVKREAIKEKQTGSPAQNEKFWTIPVILATVIISFDTFMDVGAVNVMAFHNVDPNTFLPKDGLGSLGLQQIMVSAAVGIFSFYGERILSMLLVSYSDKLKVTGGNKAEEEKLEKAGKLYNFIKGESMRVTSSLLWFFDFILTPQAGNDLKGMAAYGVVSAFITSAQMMIVRLFVRKQRVGLELEKDEKILVLAMIVFGVIDTYYDMIGYNNVMFNFQGNIPFIPDSFTMAWALTWLPVAILCTASEAFTSTIFRDVWFKDAPDGGAYDQSPGEGGSGGYGGGGGMGDDAGPFGGESGSDPFGDHDGPSPFGGSGGFPDF